MLKPPSALEEFWLSYYENDVKHRLNTKYKQFRGKLSGTTINSLVQLDEMALLEIKSRKNLIEIRKEISTVVNNKNMEKLAYLVEQGLAEQRETIKIFSEKITAFDEVIRSLEVEKQFVKDPIVRFIQIPFTIKMLKGKPTGVEGMKEILKIMKDEEERTMKFLALFKIDKTKNSN